MKIDIGPIELRRYALALLSGPHRKELLYPGTNHINQAAVAKVVRQQQFAAEAAMKSDDHRGSGNCKGGGPKLSPGHTGRKSTDQPRFNFA